MDSDKDEPAASSTTGGLAVAPGLAPTLAAVRFPREVAPVSNRIVWICASAILLAALASAIAQLLTRLIGLITNLSFYGRWSSAFASPANHHLGAWVILVPVIGGLVVGLMARYGSEAIRGHGIPEAMEQVLFHKSLIPARVTFLKPLSAAIAIGTGGPFGAEGPIIATGGALGSLFGQFLPVSADERKTLLAAGAAAGMAATFGTPVATVLLAVELLLFEFRPRSIIPVAFAGATATAVRWALVGTAPVFPMPTVAQPSGGALAGYILLGALIGFAAVGATRAVYLVEDLFEKLPIHWMWWPAIGSLAVGLVGFVSPHTMGVGYDNIDHILSGDWLGTALLLFCVLKFVSWALALGSGTSGGTLAPLFMMGGGLGSVLGTVAVHWFPRLGVDVRIAALVGMASIFAGASRALLASVVFAFETTRQPMGLLPLLGGCTAAYLVSHLAMRHSIMTAKIARRGAPVLTEYAVDYLGQMLVRDWATHQVTCLTGSKPLREVRAWLTANEPLRHHQGFPVLDDQGLIIGVLTLRDLLDGANVDDEQPIAKLIRRPPVVIWVTSTLREAADHMLQEDVGRLPVVTHENPRHVVGFLTRSDVLRGHKQRLADLQQEEHGLGHLGFFRWQRPAGPHR